MKPYVELNFSTTEKLSLAEGWRRWKGKYAVIRIQTYLKSTEKEHCAVFRFVIGQDGRDIL